MMAPSTSRVRSSAYMHWAKTQARARFNLASSGVADAPLGALAARLEDLELSGPSYYGYGPLQEALARHCGAPPKCLFAASGASLANHLALAAVVDPGDEVLVECPTYELLVSTAQFLGACVRRFPRPLDQGFQVDLADLERVVTSRCRLIVLTNLHNPSSVLLSSATLEAIGEIAQRVGARVLVDEVYLEAMFAARPPSAFRLGERFIVTSSLTKAYGLSGLRCGWVLAAPELIERIARLNDLFGVIPAHPAERLSVVALSRLEALAARAQSLLAANHALLRQFLAARTDLETVLPNAGTVVFPRLRRGSVDGLCRRLRERYDTSVAPGRFFDLPDHFRIGLGPEPAVFAAGLERLGAALDEMGGV